MAAALLLTVAGTADAQCVLTFDANAPMSGDEVKKLQVQFTDPGTRGENVIWDFSCLEQEGRPSRLNYYKDSTSVLYGSERRVMRKFAIDSARVMVAGFETPVSRMTYTKPMLYMAYPFSFGDAVEHPYLGEELYDNNKLVGTAGLVRIEADATGMFITPSKDTLHHVLRVHTERIADVSYGLESNEKACKEELMETYEWYARGFRYPILEAHVLTMFIDGKATGERKSALYCPPEVQVLLDDQLNKDVREADSLVATKGDESQVAYKLDTTPGKVVITYQLIHPSSVSALLSDCMGVVYRKVGNSSQETDGVLEVSLTGLRRGEYILHLEFGNESYSDKIII